MVCTWSSRGQWMIFDQSQRSKQRQQNNRRSIPQIKIFVRVIKYIEMIGKKYLIPPYTSISNAICITEEESSIDLLRDQNPSLDTSKPDSFHRIKSQFRSLNCFSNGIRLKPDCLGHSEHQRRTQRNSPLEPGQRLRLNQRSFKNDEHNKQNFNNNLDDNHQQTFRISKQNEFSFVSNSLKWEFDLALNQQISQSLETSINNESKVMAFLEVSLQDVVFKIFRAWKLMVQSKRQPNQEVREKVISNIKLNECLATPIPISVGEKYPSMSQIRADDFYRRSKHRYLLHWKDRVKFQQDRLGYIEYNRTQSKKRKGLECLKKYHAERKAARKAEEHRERKLISKAYFYFLRRIQSRILASHLNEMSEISYRKTLLSKAFYGWFGVKQDVVLERKTSRVFKSRWALYFDKLKTRTQVRKNRCQLSQRVTKSRQKLFIGRIKKEVQFHQAQMEIGWFLLHHRFQELKKLASLCFSNHLLLYSAWKFHQNSSLRKYFGLIKLNSHKSMYPPKPLRSSWNLQNLRQD